jgi:tRNA A-37 threonylcarbamoyl transferase component Bud32
MTATVNARRSAGTAARASSARRGSELPDDVLRQASRRLGIMSFLIALLWTLGWALDRLAVRALLHGDPEWYRTGPTDAFSAGGVALSLALFLYSRKAHIAPRVILDLGLVYQVVSAFFFGMMFHWHGYSRDLSLNPIITFVGAVALVFAAVIPSTPAKTLLASLLAVSMNPVALLIARARGVAPGPLYNMFLVHYPDYLLVGLAVVVAHVVTELGHQVATEREMGSYRLGELIGRGAMGEVYEATHRMLARPAAIKLIRADSIAAGDREAARTAVSRFRREAEAAASLRSPHTVALYDFGVTEDETLYFVMERLDGLDLQTAVQRHGPMSASRTVHVLQQVCHALAEAHASGLVHRDIKPANIHIGRLGLQYDFVKVLDFGLVKSLEGSSVETSLATAEGLSPGTPAYMAPEMLLGEPVDGRADLYALGCVAYYLLTGQLVFAGDTALQIVSKHLHTVPVPPSQRSGLRVPAALERVVLSCLAKRPEDRPADAAELFRALGAIDVAPWTQAEGRAWWSARSA